MPTLRKAKGLYTYDSELNRPEGALTQADNVVIDEMDVIEPRRGFAEYGDSFGTSSDTLSQIFFYKGRMLRHFNSTLQFDSDGSGTFSNFNGSYSSASDFRIKTQEAKGNLYFTTSAGIKKISATAASQFSTSSGYIETAGGPKAVDLSGTPSFDASGFLLPQSKVAYRILWGKRDVNNNLILGSPSPRVIIANTSKDEYIPEKFTIDFTGETETTLVNSGNNEYVTFSSKDTDYFVWWYNSTHNTEPVTANTIGKTAIGVDINGLGTSVSAIVDRTVSALSANTSNFTFEKTSTSVTATSTQEGEELTDAKSGRSIVTVTIDQQGQIIKANNANADLNFTIPADVNTTSYFYQIYRTAIITADSGIDLDTLDPGDEMNLVDEGFVTSAELTAKEVTVTEIQPESFREKGAYLYTNPNTGQGILAANEKPPVAKDVELFRNTMFYANTRTVHRLELDLLSVSGFSSGTSEIVISNEDVARTFTFVGVKQVTNVPVNTWADGDNFTIYSANDETKYVVYLDENGSGTSTPSAPDAVLVRVETATGDTDAQVATKLSDTLSILDDFSTSLTTTTVTNDTVVITNTENGNTTDATAGTWTGTITTPTQGDGEDAANNDVLLSASASTATSIDVTARSLVKIINKDASCPVYAYYISGPDDLPGQIVLENRDLLDKPFYLAVNDAAIDDKFDPTLPLLETITAISAANPTKITSAGHGLTTGDEVFIYNTDSTPAVFGKYEVTVVDVDNFTVPVEVTTAGTTGLWFLPNTTSNDEKTPNRIYYSKTGQPEAVPSLNYLDVGAKDQAIQRIIALRDNLYVLKEDSVHIVTGTTAPNFNSRLLEKNVQILAPDTAAVLSNTIYLLSSQGLVSISEGGSVSLVSWPIEDQISAFANSRFANYDKICFGLAYTSDRSYIIWAPTEKTDTIPTQAFRYNYLTKTWTRWTKSATCGAVNPTDDKLYLGSGSRNFAEQERKNGDRTDYADRDFTLSFPANPANGSIFTLSSTSEVSPGDVLVQEQYVTISIFNRLLQKLDLNPGLDDTDYYDTLAVSAGADIRTSLNSLNTKLVADDASGVVTSRTFSGSITTVRNDFNAMIDELNNSTSDPDFSDYKKAEDLIKYETYVIALTGTNKIESSFKIPILVGDVQLFKGYEVLVEWAPQHFGTPEALKQVREGSIQFDQNNFYSASVAYASDVSIDFEEMNISGRGTGYWGYSGWGEFIWGGLGNDAPARKYIPRDKQRCRYVYVRFKHINAREKLRIVGLSLEPRMISTRAYR